MLQQMLNLSNMLHLSKENELALQVLSNYAALVLEYEGSHSFNYGAAPIKVLEGMDDKIDIKILIGKRTLKMIITRIPF